MATALIVGGGVAGAALAAMLARAGCPVVLLERTPGPHHKVCGEFLSDEALRYLHDLGIDPVALGAVAVEAVRIARDGRAATAPLPFPALSLSRRVLDDAILRRASQFGADIRRGVRVRSLRRQDRAWCADCEKGEPVSAGAAFLATGKHDLRDRRRPKGIQSDLVAFKLHWRLAPDQYAVLARHVELILFPGGYAGLEPVEGGLANLCLVVRRRDFATMGQNWDALLAAIRLRSVHLDRRLADATPCWPRPLAISSIPYGFVRMASNDLWYLGDQAAVIPSFSGDGMAIALHSARLAANYYLGGYSAAAYQSRLAHDVRVQVGRATLLSCLAVDPRGQVLTAAASRLPGVMPMIARATRISDRVLARAGVSAEQAPISSSVHFTR
jgi:menaquinone-9 beta-reductase